MEGTIQVCYGGVWGSVCDDWWAVNDALVVCRQLGFSDQCEALTTQLSTKYNIYNGLLRAQCQLLMLFIY